MHYTDSIRQNLDKITVVNEIKLQLTAPQNEEKTFLLVEGIDDIALWDSLTDGNDVILYESYGGKTDIKNLILDVFDADKRVIAIVDKDYEEKNEYSKIFYYDHCNLEMMLLSDDKFFNNIVFKLSRKKNNYINYREDILMKLSPLSAIRKLNDKFNWGLVLHSIPIGVFFKVEKGIAQDRLFDLIQNKNPEIELTSQMRKKCKKLMDIIQKENLFDYTNGHDFCMAFSLWLKDYFKHNKSIQKITEKEMTLVLSMAYNWGYFKSTRLYKQLADYQETNRLKILLDEKIF